MSTNPRIAWLLQQVQAQTASPEELNELLGWLEADETGEVRQQLDDWYIPGLPHADPESFKTVYWEDAITEVLQQDLPAKKAKVVWLRRKWWMAAAVVILFVSVTLLWMNNKKALPTTTPQMVVDVMPGKQGAVLTLADGRQILLDSMGNGIIASQQGTQVVLQNGRLQYDAAKAQEVSYNTMTTPNGRQFRIQLPDGTQAWLNAASSITYPTAFTGKERKVSITGEVYFEVAHQTTPFKVHVNDGMEVQVLGTQFNVNAYNDEDAVKTTLLEGKVKVVNRQSAIGSDKSAIGNRLSAVLKPGEQAVLTHDSRLTVADHTDIEKVMAWKNGLFNFEDAKLKDVMRQLARWYNIEVEYAPNVPNLEFWGKMGRNLNLSQILKGLEGAGVHFKIADNGKKLIVLP